MGLFRSFANLLLLAAALAGSARSAQAEETKSAVPEGHSDGPGQNQGQELLLLVLEVAVDPELAELEKLFTMELGLALGRVAVRTLSLDTPAPGFHTQSEDEKTELVRPEIERAQAVAAVWIVRAPEPEGAGQIVLHMLTVRSGRSANWTVGLQPGPGVETDLALAAGELLEEAFLFSAASLPPEPEKESEPAPKEIEESRLGVLPLGRVAGGIAAGRWLLVGGGLALEWWPVPSVFGRVSGLAQALPLLDPGEGKASAWGLEASLILGYGLSRGPIVVGPFAGIAASWFFLRSELGQAETQFHRFWLPKAAVGVTSRFALSKRLALVVEGQGLGSFWQERFERASDQSLVLSTPWFEWSVLVGAILWF
jgi:hypothetical protein